MIYEIQTHNILYINYGGFHRLWPCSVCSRDLCFSNCISITFIKSDSDTPFRTFEYWQDKSHEHWICWQELHPTGNDVLTIDELPSFRLLEIFGGISTDGKTLCIQSLLIFCRFSRSWSLLRVSMFSTLNLHNLYCNSDICFLNLNRTFLEALRLMVEGDK